MSARRAVGTVAMPGSAFHPGTVGPAVPVAPRVAPPPVGPPVVGDRLRFAAIAARIALWQAAIIVAVVLVARAHWTTLAIGGLVISAPVNWLNVVVPVLCLIVVVASAIRIRGRWLDRFVLAQLRFYRRVRRQRRVPAASRGAQPGGGRIYGGRSETGLLQILVPGLDNRGYTDRLGNRIGLFSDGPAWTAILRVEPNLTARPDPARLARLINLMRGALDDRSVPLASVQLITLAAPMPTVSLHDPTATADLSARQVYWIAARFTPAEAAGAVQARGGGEAGSLRATAVAALRLSAQIADIGYTTRVLDSTELLSEVHGALGIEPVRPAPAAEAAQQPAVRPAESWWAWSVGALHQATFRLRRPPRSQAGIVATLGRIGALPAMFTCVSVLFYRDEPGPVRAQMAVRLGVSAQPTPRAARAAIRRARARLDSRFKAMNGDQGPAVRATLPLGLRLPD